MVTVNAFAVFVISVPPPVFKEKLQSTELQEEETAILRCEVSQPNAAVEWKKGAQVISSSSKYEIRQEGTIHTLKIYHLKPEDSGKYTCDNGNEQTTATLTVKGRLFCFIFKMKNLLYFLSLFLARGCYLLSLTCTLLASSSWVLLLSEVTLSPVVSWAMNMERSKCSNCFHNPRLWNPFWSLRKPRLELKLEWDHFWCLTILWAAVPHGKMTLKSQSAQTYLGTELQLTT